MNTKCGYIKVACYVDSKKEISHIMMSKTSAVIQSGFFFNALFLQIMINCWIFFYYFFFLRHWGNTVSHNLGLIRALLKTQQQSDESVWFQMSSQIYSQWTWKYVLGKYVRNIIFNIALEYLNTNDNGRVVPVLSFELTAYIIFAWCTSNLMITWSSCRKIFSFLLIASIMLCD